MAMDRIHGSPLLRHGALDGFRKAQQADSREPQGGQGTSGTEQDAGVQRQSGDQAVISPAGKQLVALRQAVDTGRAALEALPDVREDRLNQVRQRLDQGFYQSAAVRDKVAERLAGVLSSLDETTL